MLTKVSRQPATGGSTDPGADGLDRGHQRIREQQGPGERVAELRARLGIGRDPAGIVVGSARDETGSENAEQPGLGRLHDGALVGIGGLLDLERHAADAGPRISAEAESG